MRRSAAPSQLSAAAKRPKVLQSNTSPLTGARSNAEILQLLQRRDPPPAEENLVQKTNLSPNVQSRKTQDASTENERYYSVLWCKLSAKKHKDWKDDALIAVQDRTVILQDLEGKELGRASSFKVSELANLESGSTLVVGGREIQIQEAVTKEQYLSSQLKANTKLAEASEEKSENPYKVPSLPKPSSKPFASPLVSNNAVPRKVEPKLDIKPRYNPTVAGALVMPRPPADQIWDEVPDASTSVVDVVVDPLLSRHLRPHQREGVLFLYQCVMGYRTRNMYGAILADEMGLGKTLQCITLIWTLMNQGPYGKPVAKKVLIVTPSSLVKNWLKEFRRWLGRERLSVFTVDQKNRASDFVKLPLYPVMIISYEMFMRSFDDVSRLRFDLIICDEGHRLKNPGNKTSTMLSQLDCDRKILLSGTPVQNDLKEFFSLADFVNPGILGTPASFRRTYEEPIVASQQPCCSQEERAAGESRAAELSHLTSLFVLRRDQSVMRNLLPPKIEYIVFCRPTEKQVRLYQTLLDSVQLRECLSATYSGNAHLGFISAMRQICNHPSLPAAHYTQGHFLDFDDDVTDSDDEVGQLLSQDSSSCSQSEEESGKMAAVTSLLDALMEKTNERIVLVSYFTKMLDLFGSLCSSKGYAYFRLDGSTPAATRMELVDRFNNAYGNERIFLLSCKAGGVGLNLIGASRLILYDIDWNPANDLQAMARIWRDGQKRRVYVYRMLTAGSIEEKMFQRQATKQNLSGAIVDSRDVKSTHFTREDLKDLFTLKEDVDCETHALLECPCNMQGDVPDTLDETDELEDGNEARPCQLGSGNNPETKSHKTLDRLLEWEHYGPPFDEGIFNDPCLEAALQYVSFVFRSSSIQQNENT